MSNTKTVLLTLFGVAVTLVALIVGVLFYFRLTSSN
jgi:hypothetical protein